MRQSFTPRPLPQAYEDALDHMFFMNELIDASAALAVYVEKIRSSRVDSAWFLPTLQLKEALASSQIEGTQATFDGVLINQIEPNDNDKNLNEIDNYVAATPIGWKRLNRGDFDDELICEIQRELLSGKVRRTHGDLGEYRQTQNYVGRRSGEITYTPPKPEAVPDLMNNLVGYMNSAADGLRPLVRIAIIHAQFKTIHPFCDGNGRVGRILIPLYLFWKGILPEPYFFVSEALERDKLIYYRRLMDIREHDCWNEWIKFFLSAVCNQCQKYIGVIDRINALYQPTREKVKQTINTPNFDQIVDCLFALPMFDAKNMQRRTGIPAPSLNRYLNALVDAGIIFTDGKRRNRRFVFYDLLAEIRK